MNGTGLLSQPALQAALLAAAGALAYWLKDVPGLVVSWARRFFISTLTVDSRDEFLFSALVEYMDTHPRLRGVNQFTARSVRRGTAYQSLDDDLRNGQPPRAYLSPGEGLHILRLDGRWLWIRRDVQVAQAVFELEALATAAGLFAGVEAEGVATGVLGAVHRRVRTAHQGFDGVAVLREQADADAAADEELVSVQ